MNSNVSKINKGGRPAGSPNKSKLLRVEDLLAEKNVNPIEEILKLIPSLEPRDQVKTWMDIQSYVQAKPKEPDSQLILQKYNLLVQALGQEKIAAVEAGQRMELVEAPEVDISHLLDDY